MTSAAAPGHVGTEVTITGDGFTAGGTITVTYDSTKVATATVGTAGEFSATFKAPVSQGGKHNVTVTDGTNSKQLDFFMDSTPPETPAPQMPEAGGKAEKKPVFKWAGVTDPSGVTYTLEVATDDTFSTGAMVREKTGLTQAEYTLGDKEKLESVSEDEPYYWRVRAVDGAGNESEWSAARTFYTGFTFGISQGLVYTLFSIGAVLLFLFGLWLGRKTAYF